MMARVATGYVLGTLILIVTPNNCQAGGSRLHFISEGTGAWLTSLS